MVKQSLPLSLSMGGVRFKIYLEGEMKAKRILWFTVSAVWIAFSISTVSSAQTITLRMASQNPETSNSHIYTIMPWAKKLEEVTNNRVKVEIYASQTLVKGKDAWNGVKTGIADISWVFHGYYPNMTPLADVISLPALGFTSAEKGSEILWKLYEKFPSIQKEFSEKIDTLRNKLQNLETEKTEVSGNYKKVLAFCQGMERKINNHFKEALYNYRDTNLTFRNNHEQPQSWAEMVPDLNGYFSTQVFAQNSNNKS